jgi:hypothetical protein
MVEIETRKNEEGQVKSATATLDINEIINRIGEFASRIRELSSEGKEMTVRFDGFNFSINRTPEMYDLAVKVNLTIKPKKAVSPTIMPTCQTVA